jgi:hypothetical protein
MRWRPIVVGFSVAFGVAAASLLAITALRLGSAVAP